MNFRFQRCGKFDPIKKDLKRVTAARRYSLHRKDLSSSDVLVELGYLIQVEVGYLIRVELWYLILRFLTAI